jgi:hypothetical protein
VARLKSGLSKTLLIRSGSYPAAKASENKSLTKPLGGAISLVLAFLSGFFNLPNSLFSSASDTASFLPSSRGILERSPSEVETLAASVEAGVVSVEVGVASVEAGGG